METEQAYLDTGIELRIKDPETSLYSEEKLVAIKGVPATGQAGGNVEITTSSDTAKVYLPDRPDTGDMDYIYNYTSANLLAVKAICDNTTKDILIKYPDGSGAVYKGKCQTWRNDVSVGGVIECTLHTVPSTTITEKTAVEVTALIDSGSL